MTQDDEFSTADTAEFEHRGLSVEEVRRQLRLLHQPPPHVQLDRPCRIGDGIRVLTTAETDVAIAAHAGAARQGRLTKFVPASGAATRMFQSLLAERDRTAILTHDELLQRCARGDTDAASLCTFMQAIDRFAFFDELRSEMAARGVDVLALVRQGDFGPILKALLSPEGLHYGARPKGLVAFHHYGDASRTAFEEHLAEAAGTIRGHRSCRLHFTVSPDHEDSFHQLLAQVRGAVERRYDVHLEVGFSTQRSSTDTVAVDLEGRPFRTARGSLLFRPGGHGALIENLHELEGDLVFVKNIDNVVPDWLRADTLKWKKILAGTLVLTQRTIFDHLARLQGPVEQSTIAAARRCACQDLCLSVPTGFDAAGADGQRQALIEMLDRPVRICGVVRNSGEPGGGPFWIRGKDGSQSLQIVESAQVDAREPEQRRIFDTATHFNPVDLVCGVRTHRGHRFDLKRFVDSEAVFISQKSSDGRDLKTLEHPGLWNGAMAHWITIFVEVPTSTFAPVKTVLDLLRPEHQPLSRQ